MMNKLIALGALLLLFLGSCAVATAVLSPTVDSVALNLVDHATQADPLGDAMKVYETVGGGNGRTWAPIALTLIVVAVIGSVLAYLKLKPERDKQARHLLREQKRGLGGQRPSTPRSWVVPTAPTLPRVDELPMLPDGNDDGNGRSNWLN